MRLRNLLTVMLTLVLVGSLLAACTGGNKESSPSASPSAGSSSEPGASSSPEPQGPPKEFRFTLGSEPPSLDPALYTDAQSHIVGLGLFEGLYRLDPDGNAVPALAESYEVSDDGKTYTFKLRKDAKWTNGDPVTAHDFEYSWKRILAPETAADYAYMLFYLENAEQYNAGEASADQVGVKALDDYTLEVKLISATPYFLDIITHNSYRRGRCRTAARPSFPGTCPIPGWRASLPRPGSCAIGRRSLPRWLCGLRWCYRAA